MIVGAPTEGWLERLVRRRRAAPALRQPVVSTAWVSRTLWAPAAALTPCSRAHATILHSQTNVEPSLAISHRPAQIEGCTPHCPQAQTFAVTGIRHAHFGALLRSYRGLACAGGLAGQRLAASKAAGNAVPTMRALMLVAVRSCVRVASIVEAGQGSVGMRSVTLSTVYNSSALAC